MISDDLKFPLFCIGELAVVLVGMINILAAVIFQIIVPVVIFRDRLSYRAIYSVGILTLGTIVFAGILVFFRHTLIPLVLLAAFSSISLFAHILAEARMQRQLSGDKI